MATYGYLVPSVRCKLKSINLYSKPPEPGQIVPNSPMPLKSRFSHLNVKVASFVCQDTGSLLGVIPVGLD